MKKIIVLVSIILCVNQTKSIDLFGITKAAGLGLFGCVIQFSLMNSCDCVVELLARRREVIKDERGQTNFLDPFRWHNCLVRFDKHRTLKFSGSEEEDSFRFLDYREYEVIGFPGGQTDFLSTHRHRNRLILNSLLIVGSLYCAKTLLS